MRTDTSSRPTRSTSQRAERLTPKLREPRVQPDSSAMRRRYRGYVQAQVLHFLSMTPRESIRPLYRQAREWAVASGVHDEKDPYRSLTQFVEHCLPLPPFDAWLSDFYANPVEHLRATDEAPTPASSEPVPVEVTAFDLGSLTWEAELQVFREGSDWRGFILFREAGEVSGRHRTADIFLESDPHSIADRFRSYEAETLQGLLQSTLS